MIDLALDGRVFINSTMDAALQELDMLLNTTNTELIGYPDFGTDFEQFCWQLTPAEGAIKQYIQEKIGLTYFLRGMDVNINVDAVKGDYRMIYDVQISVKDNAGHSGTRRYQFK